MKGGKNLSGISDLLRKKHYAFSLCSVCTWRNRSKSRACVFWVLLILCHQPSILQTASSSRVGSQQLSPFSAHVHSYSLEYGISCLSFHMTSFHTSWSTACWHSLEPFQGLQLGLDQVVLWVKKPCSEECVLQHSVSSLTGCTRVSRGIFKLHFNPPLLITAVNYRTAANKSSLGYDGT